MTQKIVNLCVNLDERDAQGKPTVTKTPSDPVNFHCEDDIILFSISVIENSSETVLKQNAIYNSKVWNDPDLAKRDYKFVRVKETARCEP